MLPHEKVYTRLGVSNITGTPMIGIFAICDIPNGTELFEGDPLPTLVKVNATEVELLPEKIKQLYHDFCPLNEGFYDCPPSFDQMGQSWYVNHSETPNVEMSKDYEHLNAISDIKEGDEILINYHTFSEIPPNETV